MVRTPILTFGGKGNMVAKITPLLNAPCQTYVEPFGGGASILLARHPAPVEVYNDLNSDIVGFFRMLRDKEMFAEFHRLVALTPYSREEYYHCRETWRECTGADRYYRWFVVSKGSFSGLFGTSWSSAVTASARGMAMTCSRWLSTIDMLPDIAARLLRTQIENQDWRRILSRYDREDTLFYLDPPYVQSTRKSGGYQCDMTDADHIELIATVKELKGMVLLSGYDNDIYNLDWKRYSWETASFAAAKTGDNTGDGSSLKGHKRTEVAWANQALEGRRE